MKKGLLVLVIYLSWIAIYQNFIIDLSNRNKQITRQDHQDHNVCKNFPTGEYLQLANKYAATPEIYLTLAKTSQCFGLNVIQTEEILEYLQEYSEKESKLFQKYGISKDDNLANRIIALLHVDNKFSWEKAERMLKKLSKIRQKREQDYAAFLNKKCKENPFCFDLATICQKTGMPLIDFVDLVNSCFGKEIEMTPPPPSAAGPED